MKKNKIVLKENKEEFEKRVNDLNNNVVCPYSSLIINLELAGIKDISMDLIKDVVEKGMGYVETLIPYPDVTTLPSELKTIIQNERENKIRSIRVDLNKINTVKTYDGTPINSSKVLSMLQLGGEKSVNLSESALCKIEDECKEYLVSPEGIELYELQHQLAKLLQKFHDKLRDVCSKDGKDVSLDVKATLHKLFPLCAFNFKRDEDENLIITPKLINFDPFDIENE